MKRPKREVGTYLLIAYDAATGAEVFRLENVADIPNLNRPSMGEDLTDGEGARWRIAGVRKTSSAKVHQVDVRKV